MTAADKIPQHRKSETGAANPSRFDIIYRMKDYTILEQDNATSVKKTKFSVMRCFSLLVFVLASAFAYWRYGIDRPENVIIELLERYHSFPEAAFEQMVETNMGKNCPLAVVYKGHYMPLALEQMNDAIIFAKDVVIDGDRATVTIGTKKGAYSRVDWILMRWFGIEAICPKGGASGLIDQYYELAKVNGKWVPVVYEADFARVCAFNKKMLAAAAQHYRMERMPMEKEENLPPSGVEELYTSKLLKREVKCPSGGTYSFEAIPDGEFAHEQYRCTVKCSMHQ